MFTPGHQFVKGLSLGKTQGAIGFEIWNWKAEALNGVDPRRTVACDPRVVTRKVRVTLKTLIIASNLLC